jgi:hypothetical protein
VLYSTLYHLFLPPADSRELEPEACMDYPSHWRTSRESKMPLFGGLSIHDLCRNKRLQEASARRPALRDRALKYHRECPFKHDLLIGIVR